MIASRTQGRMAGFAGWRESGRLVVPVLAAIEKAPPKEWAAGVEALRSMRGVDVCRAIAQAYPSAPARTQVVLLGVLGDERHALAMPVLTAAARSEDAAMRVAALRALGETALPEAIDPLTAACKSALPTSRHRSCRVLRLPTRCARRSRGRADRLLAVLAGGYADPQLRRRGAGLGARPTAEGVRSRPKVAVDPELGDQALPLLLGGGQARRSNQKGQGGRFYRGPRRKPDRHHPRDRSEIWGGKPVVGGHTGHHRHGGGGAVRHGAQNAGWDEALRHEPT